MKLKPAHLFSWPVFGTLVAAGILKALADRYAPIATPAGIVSKLPAKAPTVTAPTTK